MVEAALKGAALQVVQSSVRPPQEAAQAAAALESLRSTSTEPSVDAKEPPAPTGLILPGEDGKPQHLAFATDFPREMTESIPEKQRMIPKWHSNH